MQAAFDTHEEAYQLVSELAGHDIQAEAVHKAAEILMQWQQSYTARCKRQRLQMFKQMHSTISATQADTDRNLAEFFEEEIRNRPATILKMIREQDKRRRKLKAEDATRSEKRREG